MYKTSLQSRRRSFIIGFGRVLDVGSTRRFMFKRTSPSYDTHSLKSDWEKVGDDIRRAITIYGGDGNQK